MNRPRKKDRDLPPCVYRKHGAFYLVRHGKWQRLAPDKPTALREYARIVGGSSGGMAAFIAEVLPRIMRDKETGKPKADETQRQYRLTADLLGKMLAQFSPEDITSHDVWDLRGELIETPAIANRALTVLKLVMDEAVHKRLVGANPVVGVERVKIGARTRRLSVAEFDRIYAHADALLQAVMALCYATGQRVMDVATIKVANVLDEGVFFEQQKTGARLVVAWTPELRAAIKQAQALKPNVLRPVYVWGHEHPSYAMIRKRWVAAVKVARIDDAVIHDIRAMSATDAKAQGIDPQALLGHTDAGTTRIYLRDKVVPVVPGPVMRRAKVG